MKVCVFGAGAIGGHVAARLAEGGAQVSVVARGANLAAMREHGLTVRAKDRTMHASVQASSDPAELGPQDAVIVTVKAPALPSVAAGIAPLLGPDTAVAFVMNGIPFWYFHAHGGPHDDKRLPQLDPEGALWQAVPPERVIGGVVYSACTVTAPGEVEVENARSRIVFGEPDGRRSARVQALAELLMAGGLAIEVTERIRDEVWAKLLGNLCAGPLGVLTASPPSEYYREDELQQVTRRVFAEGSAIAQAMGCTVSRGVDAQIENGLQSRHKSSILQDLELGRPMEIAALFETPLQLARLCGVATPVLDMLVALCRVRARSAGLYP